MAATTHTLQRAGGSQGLRIFYPEWKFWVPNSCMRYSIYILHPAEDSRVLVMGSGADVKVYTARKTKLRILSLLWLRLFGLRYVADIVL